MNVGAMCNKFPCVCAVECFALEEYLILDCDFWSSIKLVVRFMGIVLIAWEKAKNQLDDWKDFKLCLNQTSNLNCACEDLGEVLEFLDL